MRGPAFDRQDRLWAITDRSPVRVDPDGIDTVYKGMGLINTLLVDNHDNIWITPYTEYDNIPDT
jgi:hypothetical protein